MADLRHAFAGARPIYGNAICSARIARANLIGRELYGVEGHGGSAGWWRQPL